ncbi:MAG: signal peptidase I [Candidatus Andersenbacteria bacterium]|nr:signal peptidase I [Candidatus Andersenbacteria bacterium]MBI3251016.1 signal peptidase I [Candidatus Andersenbacteria bacterium]
MISGIVKFFWELIKAFLVALVIIIPIRYFLVQPFFVRGASMDPTFHDGEYLLIDQLSYRFREPRRGEVIVFRYPQEPSQFFIKRIVGLPGETVRIEDGRVVIVNNQLQQGAAIDESGYLPEGLRTGGHVEMTLQKDEFFVLGDNRPASSDSRAWGVLPEEDIIGRTWIRAFPFDRLSLFRIDPPGFVSISE